MAELLAQRRVTDGISVIVLDELPVVAVHSAARERVAEALECAMRDARDGLLIHLRGSAALVAPNGRHWPTVVRSSLDTVLHQLEASPVPTIAWLEGPVQGLGLEIALRCHYRIATRSASVGFPQLRLGLLPLDGGIRASARCGGIQALDLFLESPVPAARALALGFVDRLVDDTCSIEDAMHHAAVLSSGTMARSCGGVSAPSPSEIASCRERVARRLRGQSAPQRLTDFLAECGSLDLETAARQERALAEECLRSDQAQALTHVFRAEAEAAHVVDVPSAGTRRVISTVAVIGGGTMGAGIAISCLEAGLQVTMLEVDDPSLQRGLESVRAHYRQSVERGRLPKALAGDRMRRLSGALDYAAVAAADAVIEAVVEDLRVKRDVFAQLDRHCRDGALLCTNTSYQDVDAIAAATARPGDVLGLHFFSPANVMKLVEVVRGAATAPDALLTALAFAQQLGKSPVVARSCHGFIGNRMFRQYNREVQLCLIEGATPEQIDSAMEEWGMAMGPCAVADLSGLDVGYRARQALDPAARGDPRSYAVADALVEAGRLGRKSGAGYYRYAQGSTNRQLDPAVTDLVRAQARRLQVAHRSIDNGEIVDRLLLALINEGALLLGEGIAQRAGDIDVVYCRGYGFPAFRGGPMFHAEQIGLSVVYRRLDELRRRLDARHWSPAPLIADLAASGRSLLEWRYAPSCHAPGRPEFRDPSTRERGD